jgi:hypothetical protein
MKIKYQALTVLAPIFLMIASSALAAPAKSSPEVLIDQFLRSNSPLPGGDRQAQLLLDSIRQWLGVYKGLKKEGSGYAAVFERGSLPVVVRLKASGVIESLGFECPRSETLSVSRAPSNLRQALSSCPGLKP